MVKVNDWYSTYKEKKEQLAEIMAKSANCFEKLSMPQADDVRKASQRLNDDTFKIMVVGTFKNGKSTFINSLLGKEILPAYATPCTAVINEVKYGPEKAELYFKNPLPQKLPSSIPSEIKEYIASNKNLPPKDVPYEKIEDYVCIPMDGDFNEIALESPYDKLVLSWPLELLKNGVEVIDSPGLNEHETRTKVTNEYLTNADAIIFVLNAQQLCSQEEMKFIENNLQEFGFSPYFVVNRFDAIKEKERARITGYAHSKLDNYTDKKIYFVSSLDALDGKIEYDDQKLANSGIPELEKDLAVYLTTERGKAKLNRPAKDLDFILNFEANKCIEQQRNLLNTNVDEMKKRLEKAKEPLQNLKERKMLLQAHFNNKINTATKDLFDVVRRNNGIIASKISGWVDEYPMENEIGAWSMDDTRKEAANKLVKYIETKIDEHQKNWNRTVLQPAIKEKSIEVFKQAEKDLIDLYSDLDKTNYTLTGGDDIKTENKSVWERAGGVVGGLMLGNFSAAITGAQDGFSGEYAKSFFLEIGSFIGLGLIGLLNPITAIGTIAGVTYYTSQDVREKKIKEIKNAVKEKIEAQVSNEAKNTSYGLERKFEASFKDVADKVIYNLDRQIDEAKQRVEQAIEEKEKGEAAVTAKKELLNKQEQEIRELHYSLGEVVAYLTSK